MRKISKIASIFLALVLAVAAPLLFVGCKSDATLEEASKAVVAAARNYYANHDLLEDKYDDLTLNLKAAHKATGETPLDYKATADAEDYTHGKFASAMEGTQDVKIAVKGVQRGAGAEAYKDYHLKVENVDVEKEHYYTLNQDETLKEVNSEVKTTTIYVYASKDVNGTVEYYQTVYTKVEATGAEAEVTKEVYVFEAGRDEYMASMNQYLYQINELVEESYFEAISSEYVLLFGKFTKDGNKMEMTMDMTMPQVRQGNAALVTEELYLLINGNNVDTVSVKMVMDNGTLGTMVMDGSLKYQPSADAIELGGITDYEEVDAEIELDLPDGINLGM